MVKIQKNLTKRNFALQSNKQNLYLTIHYTANNGDTAYNNTQYFKTEYRGASANYFVDENEIWQCVRDEDIAWHCGAEVYYNNCRNENSIGIEMCSRKYDNGAYYFKDETIKNTIELVKYLMKLYNIPIENVVRHYDVTRKVCPRPYVNNVALWNDFKSQLLIKEPEDIMTNLINQYGKIIVKSGLSNLCDAELNKNNTADWAKEEIKEAIEAGITDGSRPGAIATREEVILMNYRSKEE